MILFTRALREGERYYPQITESRRGKGTRRVTVRARILWKLRVFILRKDSRGVGGGGGERERERERTVGDRTSRHRSTDKSRSGRGTSPVVRVFRERESKGTATPRAWGLFSLRSKPQPPSIFLISSPVHAKLSFVGSNYVSSFLATFRKIERERDSMFCCCLTHRI